MSMPWRRASSVRAMRRSLPGPARSISAPSIAVPSAAAMTFTRGRSHCSGSGLLCMTTASSPLESWQSDPTG